MIGLELDDDEVDDDVDTPEVEDEADPLLVGRLPNIMNLLSLLFFRARPGFALLEVKRWTERRRGPLCAFKLGAIDEQ